MTWYQEWFGEEYLELYSYRDENEARRQVAFFQQHAAALGGRPVLDLACGMGRHMRELGEAGFRAVGCDLSYVLLRTGLSDDQSMSVTRADMRSLPFRAQSFAGLVSFFTSFGYFATEEENMEVVVEMARVLEPGGLFLFDYLNVDRELQKMVQRETRQTPLGDARIERWFDPSDRSFNKRITIAGKRYMERVRGYDLEEITSMFDRSRLHIRDTFGDFHGAPFQQQSPRLILVGEKVE